MDDILMVNSEIISNLFGQPLFWSVVLIIFLTALAWADIQTLRLPNKLTGGLAAGGFLSAALLDKGHLIAALVGSACAWMFLISAAVGYRRTHAREGLGAGDAKLFAAGGAWVTWTGLPLVLLIASLSGLLFALATGRLRADEKLPFGPFLSLGIWVTWMIGPDWPARLTP